MTREEALKEREENYYSTIGQENTTDDVEELINKIYDDFESRVCKNCEYIRYPKDKTYEGKAKCMKNCSSSTTAVIINGDYFEYTIVEPNFGCNKFERKG